MKVVKKTAEYTIYQKRNNRYAVKGTNKKWVNSESKTNILLAEDLIKVTAPAPAPAPAAEPEPSAEAKQDDAAETDSSEES